MTIDSAIALALTTTAAIAIVAQSMRRAVFGTIALGLALCVAWLRLGATSVAVAELAIGVGAVGTMLLRSPARVTGRTGTTGDPNSPESIPAARIARGAAVAVPCAAIAAALVAVGPGVGDAPALGFAAAALAALGLYGAILGRTVLRRVIALRTIVAGALLLLGVGSAARGADVSIQAPAQVIAVLVMTLSAAGVAVAISLLRRLIDATGDDDIDEQLESEQAQ